MNAATSRRSFVNHLGIGILLAGMCLGCFLYWRSLQSGQANDEDDALAEVEDSRAYQQGVERNGGVFGLLMVQWTNALAKLGEPRPLAITIMVAANLAAGGCFLVAARLPAAPAARKET